MQNRPSLFNRKLLIDPSIQTPILVFSTAIATLAVILASYVSTLWAHQVVSGNLIELNWLYVWLGSVFCYFALIFTGLYVSNRIAGPIHRLHLHMNKVLKGEDPGLLSFRENDAINKEFVATYNSLIKEFKRTKSV